MRAQGDVTAAVTCHGCRRRVVIPIDRFPADLPFPDIALRLRCSACDSRNVSVMMDMQAHYARLTAETGWKMEVKPWPKVEPEGCPSSSAGTCRDRRGGVLN